MFEWTGSGAVSSERKGSAGMPDVYIRHTMRRKIPSLQALACFDAAARHQSYTRAAQELALTQSAVSRQLAALEAFIGQPLFRRTRHGVTLTPRGADYARSIAPRLQALERDTLEAMAGQGGGAQSLTLAAVPTFATRWLIPRLGALRQAHPGLVLHIETRTRPFLFADSEFDAALYAGTAQQVHDWAGTAATRILDEEMLPVCAPAALRRARPWSAAELARQPLLQQSTRPQAWRDWFRALGVEAPMALAGPRYELFSMTAAAAMQGLGVALVPRLLVEEELLQRRLVAACSARVASDRAYYFVTPEHSERASVIAFGDWLRNVAQRAVGIRTVTESKAEQRPQSRN